MKGFVTYGVLVGVLVGVLAGDTQKYQNEALYIPKPSPSHNGSQIEAGPNGFEAAAEYSWEYSRVIVYTPFPHAF